MKDKYIVLFMKNRRPDSQSSGRSNCTLTDRLYRCFTRSNNFQYLNILQTLVDGYNPSYHRSIGMKPSEVNTETSEQVWNTLYTKGL